MQTLLTLFDKQVKTSPFATALIAFQHQYDYQTIHQYAEKLKRYLLTCGIKAESPIGLCTDRSMEQLVGMVGILKSGGAYVPLDPTQPYERLQAIIQESAMTILLTHSAYRRCFKHYQGTIIYLDDVLRSKEGASESDSVHRSLIAHEVLSDDFALTVTDIQPRPDQLAYIIHTSGSTGVPKGVLIEHASVLNYAQWFAEYAEVTTAMRIDWSTPYIFDMAVTTSIVALMLGLTIVLCSDATKRDTRAYLQHLQTHGIHLIKITPSYFKALLHEVSLHYVDLPDLHTLILGGENLPMADCRAWLALYPNHNLYNEYGPTEATVAVTQHKICNDTLTTTANYVPIGKPGANMQCYILDSALKPVAANEVGELFIGGVCLARGYNHQATLTQQKFILHPLCKESGERLYQTGDLCRMQPDGTLECIGRIDQQIKLRGYRIEISEIEHRLCAHPAIENGVIIVRENDHHAFQLLAYYILKPAAQTTTQAQLRYYLQQYLPHYMIPATFIPIEAFPLTANGKLDQAALPKPFVTVLIQKPRTTIEKQLVNIWQQELGINTIGIHDNFYELGGHSLNAARIVSQINKMSQKVITLNEFYQADTITQLAKIIKKTTKKQQRVMPTQPPRVLKNMPLSDFQLLLWISKTFEPKVQRMNIVTRKRLQGAVNITALNAAFNAVLDCHPILSYRISRLYPAQRLYFKGLFALTEIDLQSLAPACIEKELRHSFDALMSLHPWPVQQPLFAAKLFHIDADTIELQMGLAHLVADEISMQIFLMDLSKYYTQYQTQSLPFIVTPAQSFDTYILHEQNTMTTHFNEDYNFWKNYLNTGGLYHFPAEYIVHDMQQQGLGYTTYQAMPPHLFTYLERFCIQHHVGLEDVLCAAVSIALKKQGYNYPNTASPMILNLIKSTRNDPMYDETLGCFVRVDPIKVDLSKTMTLLTIAKQVQRSMVENMTHLRASTLLKLACMVAQDCKRTFAKSLLTQASLFIYRKVLHRIKLNYKVLKLINYLADFNRDKHFIIYINVWNNFVKSATTNETVLGLKTMHLPMYQYEISCFDYVCDISFLRDEHQNTRYVTISGNIKPDIRAKIAHEIINMLHETIEEHEVTVHTHS